MAEIPLTRDTIAAAVRAMLRPRVGREANSRSIGSADSTSIAAVYLFGSCARGTAKTGSDIDLGLLYSVAPASTLLEQPFLLEEQLAAQLGRAVQCVVMNSAPVDLVHRILKDAALLLDSSPSHRIRFEIDARNRYFDLKPILDRYRRARRVG
jgi:predicted nucleotidyltransferase